MEPQGLELIESELLLDRIGFFSRGVFALNRTSLEWDLFVFLLGFRCEITLGDVFICASFASCWFIWSEILFSHDTAPKSRVIVMREILRLCQINWFRIVKGLLQATTLGSSQPKKNAVFQIPLLLYLIVYPYRFPIMPGIIRPPMGILFIIFIISRIWSNCFMNALTSLMSLPLPLAMRLRRLLSMLSGLPRS